MAVRVVPSPELLDGWLRELDLKPIERDEREGITSWDLVLDGRRRHDIRLTLILDPAVAAVLWVHYAPPLNDSFRVSYRKFLHWNDELPFVKFGLSADERPMLTSEVPVEALDRDALGLAVARLLTVCDLLLDESLTWLWPGAKAPPAPMRESRNSALIDRYAARLAELSPPSLSPDDPETVSDSLPSPSG